MTVRDPNAPNAPGARRSSLVFSRLAPVEPSAVYDTYWRFAAERQEIFFRRIEHSMGLWTTDPILSQYKFTNAYRASDRVSQYLIRHVIVTAVRGGVLSQSPQAMQARRREDEADAREVG